MPLFATNDWVHPLDEEIKPAYNIGDVFDSLHQLYSWKGKLYGLPIYSEVTILYYRADLLKAAGLDVPKTLDELSADAAKLNKPPRTFGIALRGLRGEGMNVYPWTEWLRSYGGDFLGPQMQPVFDSEAGIAGNRALRRPDPEIRPARLGLLGLGQGILQLCRRPRRHDRRVHRLLPDLH